MDPEKKPVEVYAERAETKLPEPSQEELKALALAYAKYLAEHGIEPGEPTFTDDDGLEIIADVSEEGAQAAAADTVAEAPEMSVSEQAELTEQTKLINEAAVPADDSKNTEEGKDNRKEQKKSAGKGKSRLFAAAELSQEQILKLQQELEKSGTKPGLAARIVDAYDRIQLKRDAATRATAENFVRGSHRIVSTYRNSRRGIGIALLLIGILAVVVLAIFDRYTVYEYAYNGKVLGYVHNQEDVTEVLDIAGEMLTANSSAGTKIEFVTNENVTFNLVDGRGKSTDDADIAINKLVYMTDIETEAYGVYDGDAMVAVVKSEADAEELLAETQAVLSEPDKGMRIVSSEFTRPLDIRPVNVLLTSVQSDEDALTMMTEGGEMDIYHIVEEGEDLTSLSSVYGVAPEDIFNEDKTMAAADIAPGDKICIHEIIEPVRVKLVEKGRMRRYDEFETVKEESDEYYKGDTHTKQEGVDGIEIFEGTITKLGGKISREDATKIEIIRERQDKIIVVGTAERPKTAPTGTYKIPLPIGSFTITSNFGQRWGRLHSGTDMGAAGGTPIYATDGGTIIRAGWYSGYGNCVDIDHGNGRVTRYGHCSRLLVSVGDQVYQGQTIALVGNTGHSFGNHLHFEIRFNDVPVNARPYLGI